MLFIAYKTLDCLMLEEGVKRRIERSSWVPFFRKRLIDRRFISSIGFRPMLSMHWVSKKHSETDKKPF